MTFWILLATAKAKSELEDQTTPYLRSFRTIDLLNAETRQPIAIPVQTSIGLVEEGYYEAHREGGILSWSNGEEPIETIHKSAEPTSDIDLWWSSVRSDGPRLGPTRYALER